MISVYINKCKAFLYPTVYEGFGMPPLEAMSCCTLAITSNTSSLPQVVGDAAIMLDPTAQDPWTDCILRVSKEESIHSLIKKNRTRQRFRWKQCTDRHLKLYHDLAE